MPATTTRSTDHAQGQREAIVLRVHDDLFAKADLSVLDEHFAPDYVEHNAAYGTLGREDLRRIYGPGGMTTVFPDLRNEADALLHDGPYVVVRLTATGTMKGPMDHVAPTGQSFSLPVIVIYRFEGDQIVEAWRSYNERALLQQIGLG